MTKTVQKLQKKQPFNPFNVYVLFSIITLLIFNKFKTHVKHAHPEYTSLISQKSIKLRQVSVSILYISLNAKIYLMNYSILWRPILRWITLKSFFSRKCLSGSPLFGSPGALQNLYDQSSVLYL